MLLIVLSASEEEHEQETMPEVAQPSEVVTSSVSSLLPSSSSELDTLLDRMLEIQVKQYFELFYSFDLT